MFDLRETQNNFLYNMEGVVTNMQSRKYLDLLAPVSNQCVDYEKLLQVQGILQKNSPIDRWAYWEKWHAPFLQYLLPL